MVSFAKFRLGFLSTRNRADISPNAFSTTIQTKESLRLKFRCILPWGWSPEMHCQQQKRKAYLFTSPSKSGSGCGMFKEFV